MLSTLQLEAGMYFHKRPDFAYYSLREKFTLFTLKMSLHPESVSEWVEELQHAVCTEDSVLLDKALSMGADINAQSGIGVTALGRAAAGPFSHIVLCDFLCFL